MRKKRTPKITEKQKVFAKTFVETGNMREAVKTAYPNSKAIQDGRQTITYGKRILRSKVVEGEISRILNKQGLTKKSLTLELYNLIHGAKKEDTKYKGIRLGFELHGAFEQEKETTVDNAEIFGEITAEAQSEIIRTLIARISAKSGSI